MMSLHKLGAGSGYTYLTRQVAANDAVDRGYDSLGEYYSERGESPGVWLGAGLAGLEHGPAAGDAVGEAQMVALFGHGQHPSAGAGGAGSLGKPYTVAGTSGFRIALSGQIGAFNIENGRPTTAVVSAEDRARMRTQLGQEWFTAEHGRPPAGAGELSDFVTAVSRPGRSSTAGYDLTFSPVKSVSVLWALANPEVAGLIEDAHRAAVADVVGWLERTATFTRLGAAGARQVDVQGLVAVAFTHRDSRSGDPDLHTHVAISNKVQTADGRWRALDGRVLHAAAVSASERYDTRLEAQLRMRLGVLFVDRPVPEGRPPVREIFGIDQELCEAWSSRRSAITTRQAELAAEFTARHGRRPEPGEARELYGRANLQTRPGKHPPRSQAAQRAGWLEQAEQVLGPDGVAALGAGIDRDRGYLERRRDYVRGPELWSEQELADWAAEAAPQVIAGVERRRATWTVHHVRAEAERRARRARNHPPLAQLDRAVDAAIAQALSDYCVRLGPPDSDTDRAGRPIREPAVLRRADGSSQFTVAGTTPYTSPAILAAEQRLLAAAVRVDGRRVAAGLVELALIEAAANGLALNDGQRDLVRGLVTSGARLQLALAPAGAGKTSALGVLARAWTEAGGTVLGLAPSAVAAAQLATATGGRTETIAKFRHGLRQVPPDAGTYPGLPTLAESEAIFLPDWIEQIGPHTLLLIDEAGMAATGDLDQTVAFVLGRGGSVRLVGDDRQLAARASGGILTDIAHTIGALTLEQVVRFADPAEAAASLQLRQGNPAGLGYYLEHQRIHTSDATPAAEQAYQAWLADRATGHDTILLAAANHTVTALNARARTDRLAATTPAEGELQVRLRDGTAASTGDPIITRRNNRHLPVGPSGWVKNGDRWHVHAVLPDGRLHVVHDDTRCHLTVPAAYVAEHVQLGYATTIHLAQGRTTDTAHVLLTGRESREALYVAMTRGRGGNHLYLDPTPTDDPDAGSRPDVIAPPTSTELLRRILATVDAQPSATSTAEVEPNPAVRLRTAITRYTEALTHTPRTHAETRAGPAADRPLPWLPAPPTGGDGDWDTYLHQRATLITDLAAQIDTTSAGGHLPGGPWADQLRHHAPALAAELAVWRAAHDIPRREPTLYATTATDPGGYQQQLADQIRAAVGDPPTACERWKPLVDSIAPAIATDPTFWPDLADAFTRAHELGIDVPARLHQAASRADPSGSDPTPALTMYLRIGGNGFPDLIPHDHNHTRTVARAPDPAPTVSRPIAIEPTPTYMHTPSPGGHRR